VQKGFIGEGGGTGFLIGSDGTVVTNHHVIDSVDDVRVKLMDGSWAEEVELLTQDADADIAILRISPAPAVDPVALGDSDKVEVGERAISIGNPLGLEHTLTDGLISARRTLRGRRMIQMSTPISPGNSGGPLFNLRGEVIGVSTATMSGGFGGGQNLNLAMPVNTVKEMLKDDYPARKRVGGGNPGAGRW
jgi:S1-C subfamily serine protease